MRIKVTKRQFQLLVDNLDIISSKGLIMQMNGNTFNFIYEL